MKGEIAIIILIRRIRRARWGDAHPVMGSHGAGYIRSFSDRGEGASVQTG
jgi:hypothetical protein